MINSLIMTDKHLRLHGIMISNLLSICFDMCLQVVEEAMA